jgi:multidrug efflux pump subunit AcrB
MEKYSVRKPFTVLVAVVLVIILGFVSLTNMSTDLLPSMSLPYMVVVTTYPGAPPDRVEREVAEPMENALGTVTNVKNVTSAAGENFAMTQLEFEDGTDMDSAMVKVSSAVNQVAASLPDGVGTPNIMEISLDMVATMYLAVSKKDADIYHLSDYVKEEVTPRFERVNGVASVNTIGLVDRSVQVELNRDKIDSLNDRVLEQTNSALRDAKAELDSAKAQVEAGQKQLQEKEAQFGKKAAEGIFGQIDASALQGQLVGAADALEDQLATLASSLDGADLGISSDLTDAGENFQDAYQSAGQDARTAGSALSRAGDILSPSVSANSAAGQTPITPPDPSALTEELESRLTDLQKEIRSAANEISQSTTLSSLTGGVSSLITAGAKAAGLVQIISAFDLKGALTQQLDQVSAGAEALKSGASGLPQALDGLKSGAEALLNGQLQAAVGFSTAANQLTSAQSQLDAALNSYETQRAAALKNANVDSLISASTLSQLVYAQNFSMPAGYLDDKHDNSWLLKVGDEYTSSGQIDQALLADIDGIGTIRLSDVADVTVIDNARESYTKLNGQPAVVLGIYKGSTAGTNEVSRALRKSIKDLEQGGDGVRAAVLMDQGEYITQIVNDILSSMALGALLAILVLALFLRDIRPTLIVGISIPISVLFTIVLMYFSRLSMNIMTLGGLSLGIGMLVDNSIVVMENIIRLRQRGMTAARASVQGARQVSGAIISSTLTTVCVFLPMVFTTGTVRELLIPMALSITYCLTASLIVAQTVVPASASFILRRVKAKKRGFFDRVLDRYEVAVSWVLNHKTAALLTTVALLGLSIWRLTAMGIVILPEMTSDNIQIEIATPEGLDKETSHKKTDEIMEAVMKVPGVSDSGAMDQSASAGLVSSLQTNTDQYGNYIAYVSVKEGAKPKEVRNMVTEMKKAVKPFDSEVTISTGGMSDTSALASTGLTAQIYGEDADKLVDISEQLMKEVRSVRGFEQISNGTEDNQKALHLKIDKDKARSYGLTVAQIYAQIASRLTTYVTSTRITDGKETLDVTIKNETNPLTYENLLDMEFESASSVSSGGSAASQLTGGASPAGGWSSLSGGSASLGTMWEGAAMSQGGSLSSAAKTGGFMSGGTSSAGNLAGGSSAKTETQEDRVHKLSEFATLEETETPSRISRENQRRYMTVTAVTSKGYNTTLLSRKLESRIKKLNGTLPEGYEVELGGETTQVSDMVSQMSKMLALALAMIYLVMVAQFQSLLSPFIILFTIPLAFTGGMVGLIISGQQVSMMALMGFLVLMGTVVNNGIVFVDYTNQLRMGGMERREALIAAGRTRMRPILMTAMTTILAMTQLIFGSGMGSQMSRGMAIVIAGGLTYATFMTLFIVPVMYDIFYKRQPLQVDVGSDINDAPDDAAEFLAEKAAAEENSEAYEEALEAERKGEN